MNVYLAVLEDRHIDTQIEVFDKMELAHSQISTWEDGYTDSWVEKDITGWEYYVRSDCDDGPNMRIEKKVLELTVGNHEMP